MAFGDIKGTLVGTGASTLNPSVAAGSVSIAVDDLIVGVMCEQTGLTVTACGDNVHGASTYTAQNAGNDPGTPTGRMFYKIVTTAGTLTAVNFVASASAHNFSVAAVVFEGPFTTPPIDANPANLTNDITDPFACPATGTLAQADELIVGWIVGDSVNAWGATSPGVIRVQQNDTASECRVGIQSWVVSATTTVTPQFTLGDPSGSVLGTASFKKTAASGPTAWDGAATFAGSGGLSAAAWLNLDADVQFQGAGTARFDVRQPRQQIGAKFGGAGTLSIAARQGQRAAATFQGAGSLSANVTSAQRIRATFQGAGGFSVVATKFIAARFAGAGGFSVLATIAAGGTVWSGAATFAGEGSFLVRGDHYAPNLAHAHLGAMGEWALGQQVKSPVAALTTAWAGLATFSGAGGLSVTATLGQQIAARFLGAGDLSADADLSQTAAATFQGAGNLTVSMTFVRPTAATFTGSGLLSVSARQGMAAAATFSGAGGLSALLTSGQSAAATLQGAGSLAISATFVRPATATFQGAGGLSVAAVQGMVAAATFNGASGLSVNVTSAQQIAARFQGAGSFSPFATITGATNAWSGEATFQGAGTLSVATTQQAQAAAIFTGLGALSVSFRQGETAAATFQGAGSLSADAQQAKAAAATFSGAGLLTVAIDQAKIAAATFQGAGSLSALATQGQVAAVTLQGSGSLSIRATLAEAAFATFLGSGTLSVDAAQSAAQQIAATFNGAGTMSARAALGQQAAATFAGAGGLSIAARSGQAIAATFSGAGNLTASVTLRLPAAATFAGAGTFRADTIQASTIQFISARFSGTGGLSANTQSRQQAQVRFAGAGRMSARIEPAEPTFVGVTFPAFLEAVFLKDGFSHKRAAASVRTEMESGFDRARVIERNPLRNLNCQILFTAEQARYFHAWYDYRELSGEVWFQIDLPLEGSTSRALLARFVGEPKFQPFVQTAGYWRMTAQLEINDQNTVRRALFPGADDHNFPVAILGDPGIQTDGYQHGRASAGDRSQDEGTPVFRNRTRTPFRNFSVTWLWTSSQVEYFNSWLEYRARYDAAFFYVNLFTDVGGQTDPSVARPAILLHFDGAKGGTTFSDAMGHAWTASGDAQTDTAQSKFGGASGLFDGVGSVSTPASADFDLSSHDWTLDFWFIANDAAGPLLRIGGQYDSGVPATTSVAIYRQSSGFIQAAVSNGIALTGCTATTLFTDTVNTGLHHVALVRTGDLLKLFIDGVQEGISSFTGTIPNSPRDFEVGNFDGGNGWNGWLDEFRLTVGTALWTSNFTPPTAPMENIGVGRPLYARFIEPPTISAVSHDLWRCSAQLEARDVNYWNPSDLAAVDPGELRVRLGAAGEFPIGQENFS